MATPARKLILDDIADTLADILVANSYKTTVVTVDREVKTWAEVGTTAMPWLGFCATETSFSRQDHQPSGWIKCSMRVVIVGHVNQTTGAEKTDALANLEDDIIAAMLEDPRRGDDGSGPNAIGTYLVASRTDEGDPFTRDSRGGSGTIVVEFDVLYMRTSGKS